MHVKLSVSLMKYSFGPNEMSIMIAVSGMKVLFALTCVIAWSAGLSFSVALRFSIGLLSMAFTQKSLTPEVSFR